MTPIHIPRIVKLIGHWHFVNFVKWFSKLCGVQCSGKYRWGYANCYCQLTAGHSGTCIDGEGMIFRKGEEKP